MLFLVTGGAGFIGRWVVKGLLDMGHGVVVIDNLSNGSEGNISEFKGNPDFVFIRGDILDMELLGDVFRKKIDVCIHLAAQIEVQESLENPKKAFENNVIGTHNLLECCRANSTKMVLVGTCMVYETADMPINEMHSVNPVSPYAGSKLAAEQLAYSYYRSYGLPVVILRPFNTYGPFQKSNQEGGVVSVFIQNSLSGHELNVYGSGEQTRDLLYIDDCVDFIIRACFSSNAIGEVINAGTGTDISINDLARLIERDGNRIRNVPHIHPDSEIMRLVCDPSKAKRLLGWKSKTLLEDGIERTRKWVREHG